MRYPMRPFDKVLFAQVCEQKEMIFLRWVKSGYKDFSAHKKYMVLYDKAQRILHAQPLKERN